MNEENQENEGLSLKDIFHMFRVHWIGMIVITLIGTMVGLGIGLNTPTRYQSSQNVYIYIQGNQTSSSDSQNIVDGLRMINTFKDFVTDSSVAKKAIDRISNLTFDDSEKQAKIDSLKDISYTNIVNGINTSTSDDNTLCVTVYYTHVDAFIAKVILENVIEATKEVASSNSSFSMFKNRIQTSYNDTTGEYVMGRGNCADIKIVSKGTKFYVAIGFVVGLVAGVGYAIIRELMDSTIKDKNYLENKYKLKVIGSIPEFVEDEKNEKK